MSHTSYLTAFPQHPSQSCPVCMPVPAKCVSGCRVCQSLMKRVPPSQVSLGRGVGEEGVGGRSSGVKDNRIRGAPCVHYTVTQHSHFLSLPFFFFSLPAHSCRQKTILLRNKSLKLSYPAFSFWRPAKKCSNNKWTLEKSPLTTKGYLNPVTVCIN